MSSIIALLIRLFTGVRILDPTHLGHPRTVLYAPHSSHFDFLTIWAALPAEIRKNLRPVAAADYWGSTSTKRWLSRHILHALLIDRSPKSGSGQHPLAPLATALETGSTLLIFPQGTRATTSTGSSQLPFKAGIYHLARRLEGIHFVPVRLENLGRILPKGEFLPLPIIARIALSEPLTLQPGEPRESFLHRARTALD